jgi:hypothetical protein
MEGFLADRRRNADQARSLLTQRVVQPWVARVCSCVDELDATESLREIALEEFFAVSPWVFDRAKFLLDRPGVQKRMLDDQLDRRSQRKIGDGLGMNGPV